jgi:flagellar biosynthesis protein FlhG
MGVNPADHYEALGLGPGATPEEVERAYRFLEALYAEGALATYSLLEPEEAAAARARVRAAYEALSDPERRRAYDAGREAPRADEAAGAEPRPATTGAGEAPPPAPEVAPVASAAPPAPEPPPPPPPRPALPAPRSPSPPALLPEPVTGATLKRFREERGVALADISARTKVGVRFLEYIEADRHADLPALVYLKGFLGEYARYLGLDVRRTVESYLSRVRLER